MLVVLQTVARPFAPVAGALLLLLASAMSEAAIYRCQLDDGSRVYQDRPCSAEPIAQPELTRNGRTPAETTRAPGGIHASWFDTPDAMKQPVHCESDYCRCGTVIRKLNTDLEQAVADALYLDGNWHRFETVQAKSRTANGRSATDRAALQRELATAACDVMLSQTVLRRYLLDAIDSYHRYRRDAEAHGFDDPVRCNEGDSRACDFLERKDRFERLQGDLKALQQPRQTTLPLDQ